MKASRNPEMAFVKRRSSSMETAMLKIREDGDSRYGPLSVPEIGWWGLFISCQRSVDVMGSMKQRRELTDSKSR